MAYPSSSSHSYLAQVGLPIRIGRAGDVASQHMQSTYSARAVIMPNHSGNPVVVIEPPHSQFRQEHIARGGAFNIAIAQPVQPVQVQHHHGSHHSSHHGSHHGSHHSSSHHGSHHSSSHHTLETALEREQARSHALEEQLIRLLNMRR